MSRQTRFDLIDAYTAKYRVHDAAKCSANRLESRLELIRVSRRYWPPQWRFSFWKLLFDYKFTHDPLTAHYMVGESLLYETIRLLDNVKRRQAVGAFIRMHRVHPAAWFYYDYQLVVKRILKEAIGPAWFWRVANNIRRALKIKRKGRQTSK